MAQPAGQERLLVSCATVQAHRGYREDRIAVRRAGQPEPIALIALPAGAASTRGEALAAFGWHLAGELEYVAGPNEERGTAQPAAPAAGRAAEQLRETVRQEILARTLARLAHPTAAHFEPVLADGDDSRGPLGWTFRIRHRGADSVFAWVSAAGRLADGAGTGSRAEAARTVRHWHAAGIDTPASPDPADADLYAMPGPELARLLMAVRNGAPAGEVQSARPRTTRGLAAMSSRTLAPNRCVHHRYAREDTAGDPVAACAANPRSAAFGVLVDEGTVGSFDCAVEAANEAARLNGRCDLPDDAFFTWALLCADHEEQPADGYEEWRPEGAEKTPAEDDEQI